MPIAHLLEDFGPSIPGVMASMSIAVSDGLDQELEVFEKGYKAGWEDACSAKGKEQTHIGDELAQNLQDMSFTYHEACGKISQSLHPLFTEIVNAILPELAQVSVGAHVAEQLLEITKEYVNQPVQIMASAANIPSLESVLGAEFSGPFELLEDAALSDGQVHLQIGSTEREIDIDNVVENIRGAFEAFAHQTQQEMKRG